MVATTQLRLALEAEDERSAKKMEWIGFGLDLDLFGLRLEFSKMSRNVLARHHFSSSYTMVVRDYR